MSSPGFPFQLCIDLHDRVTQAEKTLRTELFSVPSAHFLHTLAKAFDGLTIPEDSIFAKIVARYTKLVLLLRDFHYKKRVPISDESVHECNRIAQEIMRKHFDFRYPRRPKKKQVCNT